MPNLGIGGAALRVEDERFLRGAGQYIDDLVVEGAAQAVIVRATHAHADITGVDTGQAMAAGALAVLTGADQDAAGILPIQPYVEANPVSGEPFAFPIQDPLARNRVRYAGQPVAVVVAETAARAMDCAERVAVDYAPLPACVTIPDARGAADGADAPVRAMRWSHGDPEGVARAMDAAAHVTRLTVHNHRIITNPMEPRGLIACFDPATGRYTVHVSCQSLHLSRDQAAKSLGVAPEAVRLVAPDVGGGFGDKNFLYPEHVLIPWAARAVGRPVKWIATRSEVFLADHQARDQLCEAALALDGDGRILALRTESWTNLGAYMVGGMGRSLVEQFAHLPGGPYDIPAIEQTLNAVYTNTSPLGVTRGPGFAENANVIERLVDKAAREMGLDPAEPRRRNLVPRTAMPYRNAVGATIDTGDFATNLEAALAGIRADHARSREDAMASGQLIGLGIAYHIKGTFGVPEENVELRFPETAPGGAPDELVFSTGTQAIGQGHETTFPQIVSDLLGVPTEQVRYQAGDTDKLPTGGGHGSSRATNMAGTALYLAAQRVIERGRAIAAGMLEAAEADITFAEGRFQISGTDSSVGLFDVARHARGQGMPGEGRPADPGQGLDTYQHFVREAHTYPNGAHVAVVEIDPETGVVSLLHYATVDDFGTVINPMVLEGQAHGAIAQGVGQALLEQAVHDPASGQLLSGSFMDYALPRADDLPNLSVGFAGIACATNPLGVKGAGEAGAIAAFPAVTSAVLDALEPYGVTEFNGPATPERVWRLIHGKA